MHLCKEVNMKKVIIYLICFVALIVGAKFGYDYLSENYEREIPENNVLKKSPEMQQMNKLILFCKYCNDLL